MYLEISTNNSILLFKGYVYYYELVCGDNAKIDLYQDRTTILETIKLKKDYVIDIMTSDEGKLIGQILI